MRPTAHLVQIDALLIVGLNGSRTFNLGGYGLNQRLDFVQVVIDVLQRTAVFIEAHGRNLEG